jgi:Domain of unknown function (DUF4388)
MPLAGTFDVLDLADVLMLLARRGCSGRLYVRAGQLHGTIRLVGGEAVGAESNETNSAEARRNWQPLLEDICFEALRAGRGSFEFQPEEPEGSAGPRADVETVITAARQRLTEWREVEGVIPSLDAVPRLTEGLKADEVTLDRDRWRLLVNIDGRRSVSVLARRLDLTLLRFGQLLKPLVENGAVILESAETRLTPLPTVRLELEPKPVEPQPDAIAEPARRSPLALAGRLRPRQSPSPAGEAG